MSASCPPSTRPASVRPRTPSPPTLLPVPRVQRRGTGGLPSPCFSEFKGPRRRPQRRPPHHHRHQREWEFSPICPTDACASSTSARRVDVFCLVPLTSDDTNLHVGQRVSMGGGQQGVGGGVMGWQAEYKGGRKTLGYHKAFEKLYNPRGQTIISQTLHAYVIMRLSTSYTPTQFKTVHLGGEWMTFTKKTCRFPPFSLFKRP